MLSCRHQWPECPGPSDKPFLCQEFPELVFLGTGQRQKGPAGDAAPKAGEVHRRFHTGYPIPPRNGVVDADGTFLQGSTLAYVARLSVLEEFHRQTWKRVGQRDSTTDRASQHRREQEVDGTGEHVKRL